MLPQHVQITCVNCYTKLIYFMSFLARLCCMLRWWCQPSWAHFYGVKMKLFVRFRLINFDSFRQLWELWKAQTKWNARNRVRPASVCVIDKGGVGGDKISRSWTNSREVPLVCYRLCWSDARLLWLRNQFLWNYQQHKRCNDWVRRVMLRHLFMFPSASS